MRPIRRQAGAALIALVAVLVIAVTAGIISIVNAALSQGTTNRKHNAAVLQQAKEALIGYVVSEVLDLRNPMPGRLPCPEAAGDAGTSLEGRASGNCSAATSIGRLPWRTLGIDKFVDAASEPLWYAVSPNWAGSGATLINPGTPGQLSVDGVANVVAVIVAPGPALRATPTSAQQAAPYACGPSIAQSRNDRSHVPSGGNPDVTNYLECLNTTFPPSNVQMGNTIIGNDTNPVLNDQMVYITAKEILDALQGPVAERLQKTVAPLLNEFSTSWVRQGSILPTPANTYFPHFMPYAFAFTAPENGVDKESHCGATTGTTTEGLLPLAGMSVGAIDPCRSPWEGVALSAPDGIQVSSCTQDAAGAVTCPFRYYRLTSITLPLVGAVNLFQLLGVPGPGVATVTLQATAPRAASTFRRSLRATDITIDPTTDVGSATFTQLPSAVNGSANLSIQIQISHSALCLDTPAPALNVVCGTLTTLGSVCNPILGGFICGLLSIATLNAALTTSHDVNLRFPALSNPTVEGSTLLPSVSSGVATPINLLTPVSRSLPQSDDPHYWFVSNEWYRYTHYAAAPSISAAQTGANLTVSGFPTEFGGPTGKRFVLTLMGPAVAGQTRGTSATIDQYLEGENASANTTFAYQVFDSSGNDRVATCPATSICN